MTFWQRALAPWIAWKAGKEYRRMIAAQRRSGRA